MDLKGTANFLKEISNGRERKNLAERTDIGEKREGNKQYVSETQKQGVHGCN